MADFSRPLASVGKAGQITFRPGAWANHGSGLCEWNADPRTPPPDGPPRRRALSSQAVVRLRSRRGAPPRRPAPPAGGAPAPEPPAAAPARAAPRAAPAGDSLSATSSPTWTSLHRHTDARRMTYSL